MATRVSFGPQGLELERMLEGAEVKRLKDKGFLLFPTAGDSRHGRSQGLPFHGNVALENMLHGWEARIAVRETTDHRMASSPPPESPDVLLEMRDAPAIIRLDPLTYTPPEQ